MSHRYEPMKDPRRAGKHVSAAIDFLVSLGLGSVEVVKRKHLHLSWAWGPRRLSIVLPCTPKNTDDATTLARQRIRKAIREASA